MIDLASLVRTIPDYPKPGILFRDVTTLLSHPAGFTATIHRMVEPYLGRGVAKVAGIEARGFILGGAIAHRLNAGFVALRTRGKLPGETVGTDYQLEYGSDRIEMHVGAVGPGERVLVVDDLIATGGTALAGVTLLRGQGAVVEEACFVIDLPDLGGAERLRAAGVAPQSVIAFPGH